jgi:ubiquinone/menaquinone biosynthesis C-methylase UbiE
MEENPRGFDVNLRYEAQLQEYEAIADRIERDRPARVLDWGCGWGQMTDLLTRRGLTVEAFDYVGPSAPEAVVTLEKYPHLTAFRSGQPVALPYEDDAFDAVLSCGVLEHVQDPGASLDELHRVLKPGGRLYVYKLPNRRSYLEAIAKRAGLYYHGKLENDTLYTVPSAVQLVRDHGYDVQEARLANMLPLTAGGEKADRYGKQIWRANTALSRVPGLRVLATNVELIAVAR